MAQAVKFVDKSQEAKNGMLKQQYTALRAAGSEMLKLVRNRAKAQKGKAEKHYISNIAVRTYTRTKYGFVVAHIGFKNATKAKGEADLAELYDEERGSSMKAANPYLSNTVRSNVKVIRDKLAEYLPYIYSDAASPNYDEVTE